MYKGKDFNKKGQELGKRAYPYVNRTIDNIKEVFKVQRLLLLKLALQENVNLDLDKLVLHNI